MKPVGGTDQLRRNPDPVARKLHAAFEDVRDLQRQTDVAHCGLLVLERETRRPRGHLQVRNLCQHVQQRFGQAVGEVLVVVVARHVDERQNGNRSAADFGAFGLRFVDGRPPAQDPEGHDQDRDHGDHDIIEAPVPAARPRALGDLRITFDALWRHFEKPGEQHDRYEAERKDEDHRAGRPRGRAEFRQDRRQDLRQQPADDEIGERHPEDVAATEFGDEAHGA